MIKLLQHVVLCNYTVDYYVIMFGNQICIANTCILCDYVYVMIMMLLLLGN
jgi:hypothetical protein